MTLTDPLDGDPLLGPPMEAVQTLTVQCVLSAHLQSWLVFDVPDNTLTMSFHASRNGVQTCTLETAWNRWSLTSVVFAVEVAPCVSPCAQVMNAIKCFCCDLVDHPCIASAQKTDMTTALWN